MRVTIVIEGLSSGGAERAASFLAEGLVQRGFTVSFVTLNMGDNPFYSPPEGCKIIDLALCRKKMPFFKRTFLYHSQVYRSLEKTLQEADPDVVVSFGTKLNCFVLGALRHHKTPVVITERGDPLIGRLEPSYRLARQRLYPKARAIVCLTHFAADYFTARYPNLKAIVIPNPVFPFFYDEATTLPSPDDAKPCQILSVGRLCKQKNFPLLLEAFALTAPKHPQWTLTIYGEGKQARGLAQLAERLGIEKQVHWMGTTRNLIPVYKSASIYVQTSLYEGFCNTLCEAMAFGLPSIATAWNGVTDLIEDGKNGLVVPFRAEALASALERLMDDPLLRQKLGTAARDVRERFKPERVLDQWEEVVRHVGGGKGN